MSRLTLKRGETNRIERQVHLSSRVNDWKITELRFWVTRHGADKQDILLEKTVHTPPGGISMPDVHHVVIELEPDDLERLPASEEHFDWTLDFEPGTYNRFVLDEGSLVLT